jgi:hypothetical protein
MSNEWISVKERLPDYEEWVYVYGELDIGYHKNMRGFAQLKNNVWEIYWDGYMADSVFYGMGFGCDLKDRYVTHWMPLPEPPQEEPEVKVGM